MIGDHKQLRPKPNTYALEREPYNLRVSLFEKLVEKGVCVDRLTVQHRMRPEIRELLVPDIYADLDDHASVKSMPHIRGMKHNLYFIDHEQPEDSDDTSSHSNMYEAKYLTALAQYLLQQGYQQEDITILAPYRGQTRAIKDLTVNHKAMRVTTVDNYQGEESNIILLSLVRSNRGKRIGFMSDDTRVCVALSRARQGLYVIGNSKIFASNSQLWKSILSKMKKKHAVGQSLWLRCERHEKPIETEIKTVEEFAKVSLGGCAQPCGSRLECGHACPENCHSLQQLNHAFMPCTKPCNKTCDNGHKCRKKCFEPCRCSELMEKLIPKCGHVEKVACDTSPEDHVCKVKCVKQLPCGHECGRYCGKPCTQNCMAQVDVTLPCGHKHVVTCCKQSQPVVCDAACECSLACKHPCPGTCGTCFQGRLHVPCQQKCDRMLVCGHVCRAACSDCPPCERPCMRRCTHSRCERPCWEDCVPCREPCGWRCEHYACTQQCGEPCDRPRCDIPCTKLLPCGHPCVGLCSEPCPKLCRICDKDKLCAIFFGNEDEPDARFIQLDCQHVFEVTGIDEWLDRDVDTANEIQPVQCPSCKRPVYSVLRYGELIKQVEAEIDVVKIKIARQKESLKTQVTDLVSKLQQFPHCVSARFLENLKKRHREDLVNIARVLVCLCEHLPKHLPEHLPALQHLPPARRQTLDTLQRQYKQRIRAISQRQFISQQEMSEFEEEFERSKLMAGFWMMAENEKILELGKKQEEMKEREGAEAELQPFDVRAKIEVIQELFGSGRALSSAESRMVREVLKKSGEISLLPGVTEEERKMIVETMGFRPGHWYKCPKGHVYIITECGGAMQESQCPECGARIGGTQHRLTDGNAVASEMDGASHAAWSEAANMQNFDLDNLIFHD
jgi:hypothetical protein